MHAAISLFLHPGEARSFRHTAEETTILFQGGLYLPAALYKSTYGANRGKNEVRSSDSKYNSSYVQAITIQIFLAATHFVPPPFKLLYDAHIKKYI